MDLRRNAEETCHDPPDKRTTDAEQDGFGNAHRIRSWHDPSSQRPNHQTAQGDHEDQEEYSAAAVKWIIHSPPPSGIESSFAPTSCARPRGPINTREVSRPKSCLD